jgi:ketosteroid isomerase-like protein
MAVTVGDNLSVSSNLDLVRSIFADWERGDFTSADWAAPGIDFGYADGLEAGSRAGQSAMVAQWSDFLAMWDEFRTWADEYRQLDNGSVLVLLRLSGRGKTSGLDVRQTGAVLFQVDDGKVTRLLYYNDRDRALADLGLAPESGSP